MWISADYKQHWQSILPSNFNTKSSKNIILQTESPSSLIPLLVKELSSTFRQPFRAMLRLFPPGLTIGSYIYTGTEIIKFLIPNLANTLERVLMCWRPLLWWNWLERYSFRESPKVSICVRHMETVLKLWFRGKKLDVVEIYFIRSCKLT
jgi:hypothetical protein